MNAKYTNRLDPSNGEYFNSDPSTALTEVTIDDAMRAFDKLDALIADTKNDLENE